MHKINTSKLISYDIYNESIFSTLWNMHTGTSVACISKTPK